MKSIINFFKEYWITIAIIVVVICIYGFLTQNDMIDGYVFSKIPSILNCYKQYGQDMIINIFQSFCLLLPSLFLGTVIALVGGIITGMNGKIRKVTHPIIYAISVIPALILAPVALYVAPTFSAASRFLIVWATIWPTFFATVTGVRTIDKRYLDNAATLELTGWDKMKEVVLPAAMPSILAGFITALRSSFLVLVFAEMYGCSYGMGYFIQKYATYGIYSNVWAGLLEMVLILVFVMKAFEAIQKRLLRWTMD